MTRPASSDWLLISEVALVARTSVETVRYWIKCGRLRSSRPGRRRLVRRSDLETFLERNARGVTGEARRR
jgi:excisionase family DNA binding protein